MSYQLQDQMHEFKNHLIYEISSKKPYNFLIS